MSDRDSFIDEVTEEVRRDRLFALMRRWGWVAALAVLVLVGGAAWNEWRRAQDQRVSRAFGDALLAALDQEDAGDRLASLNTVTPETPEAEMLLALLRAGEQAGGEEAAAAADRLRELAARGDIPDRYRDLALLKAHMLSPEPRSQALATLDRLAQPGAPYRALAIEQQAYLLLGEGDIEGGIALLRELEDDASATRGLQQRAGQLIVALESGAVLLDAAPEDDAGEGAGEEAGEEAGDQPEDVGGAPASDGGMSAGEDDTPADDGTPRTETGEPAE